MKLARIVLATLSLSLATAACAADITAPEADFRPEKSTMGQGLLGSGS